MWQYYSLTMQCPRMSISYAYVYNLMNFDIRNNMNPACCPTKFNKCKVIYYDCWLVYVHQYVYRIYGENGEVMGLIDHEVGEST